MELEEAHNNLRAMRLLYRLLEDNTLGLQNANSEDLVERARALLKDMLDVTAERTIETILKIIETQAGMSKTTCTSPCEKPVASLQLKPLMAVNSSQCSLKYPTRSRITSRKNDEQLEMKLPVKQEDPWLSKSGISDKGKNKRKTLCRIGEESSMMEFNSRSLFGEQQHNVSTSHEGEHSKEPLQMFQTKAYEFKEVNETPSLSRSFEIQRNPSASSCVEPQDEEENISNDLANAIKRIESRIMALQLCSYLALSKKSSAGEQSMHKEKNSDNLIVQKNEETAVNGLGSGKTILDKNRFNQQTSQLTSKSKNLTLANGSLSNVANQIHKPEILVDLAERNGITIQGRPNARGSHQVRFGESQMNAALALQAENRQKGEMLLSQNGVQNMARTNRFQCEASECIHGLRVPLNQDNLTRRSSMLADSTTMEKPIRKNPVVQPYTDKRRKHSFHQIFPHLHRESHKMRTSLPQHHHHESEESISSSGSSASRTSQQSYAINSSDSEDYLSYDENSEESDDSYSRNDSGSLKSDKSYGRREPEKSIGRLRRLKNKLGLIFHHHHHHHLHYHDEENAKVDHGHSMWNGLQKIFHGKNNKHKVMMTKGKVEKTRRGGAVARVPRGKQVGKFHGLVEGLLRQHIRHSKKQKPSSKVRIKGSKNSPRENRKKLHWWQVLRRHRGMKLKNRGRLKVGFKSKSSS